jgi:hypothetical protein
MTERDGVDAIKGESRRGCLFSLKPTPPNVPDDASASFSTLISIVTLDAIPKHTYNCFIAQVPRAVASPRPNSLFPLRRVFFQALARPAVSLELIFFIF